MFFQEGRGFVGKEMERNGGYNKNGKKIYWKGPRLCQGRSKNSWGRWVVFQKKKGDVQGDSVQKLCCLGEKDASLKKRKKGKTQGEKTKIQSRLLPSKGEMLSRERDNVSERLLLNQKGKQRKTSIKKRTKFLGRGEKKAFKKRRGDFNLWRDRRPLVRLKKTKVCQVRGGHFISKGKGGKQTSLVREEKKG